MAIDSGKNCLTTVISFQVSKAIACTLTIASRAWIPRISLGRNDNSVALCICGNEIFFLHYDKDGQCEFKLYNFTNNEERWFGCLENYHRWEAFSFEKSLVSIE